MPTTELQRLKRRMHYVNRVVRDYRRYEAEHRNIAAAQKNKAERDWWLASAERCAATAAEYEKRAKEALAAWRAEKEATNED